ncbi:UvrD-helicase domain-containing protein [Saccharopolyspora sp. NPDC050389]|uniref:UvrD-helicase domain-containing protein n=1 Tax=Saccharopolyspora sp. NPDC050389 TaxID=3155516 RepID=UPI0033E9BA18
MAKVVFAKEFQKNLKLEGSLKSRAWDLLQKLSSDPDLTGLDLKIPQGARDPRVRTAKVTDNFRAVFFAAGTAEDQYYVLVAIRPHDEAYKYATRITIRLNPMNGIAEVLGDFAAPQEAPVSKTDACEDDRPLLLPYRVDELKAMGILPELAEHAVVLRDEDELEKLCLHAPAWQASALLDLAFGMPMDEVVKIYGSPEGRSTSSTIPIDANDPKQFRDSLDRAASQMEFVLVEGDEHLRRMLDGDFAAWRTFLHPEQRQLVERDRRGSYRVTGGAGTGKTVVAMHRAAVLAERDPKARILVTTFTKNLAIQLKADLSRLAGPEVLERIDVKGIDQLARDVVARAQGARTKVLNDRDQQRKWQRAVDGVPDLPAADRAVLTPYFLMREYQQVVLGMKDFSSAQYLAESRKGRGVRLNRVQRVRVWRVVEEFTRLLAAEDRTTYANVAAKAAEIANSSDLPSSNRYDHVIVDEAQDLLPAHWRLLRGVVAEGPNDLFICEDAHQRIYGERVVLSRFDINTKGRSQRLTLNYRTTRQTLQYATHVLNGADFVDLEEEDESTLMYRSLLTGPEPVRHSARSWRDEKAYIADTIRSWLNDPAPPSAGAVAVLTYQWDTRDEIVRMLQSSGIPAVATNIDGPVDTTSVQVSTMHRAKGTEFARCIVAGVGADTIPSRYRIEAAAPDERPEIEQRDRCLLYVACTRPRDQLVVTWTGKPSPLLPT